jgi:hypothetical protein
MVEVNVRAEWCAAFAKAQARFVNPPKSKTVSTGKFSYSYAELPDIIDSVRDILREHGLSFAQPLENEGATGFVGVSTVIFHEAGHSEAFGPLFMPAGSTPQEYGSAATYARRYSLCAALGIAADEDDDGAAASKKAAAAASLQSAAGGAGSPPDPPTSSGGGGDNATGRKGKASPAAPRPSATYPRSASDCASDGHPSWVDGESHCPDCGRPSHGVLSDRGKLV